MTEADTGQYHQRAVAFLDILGFSSWVENADDPIWRNAIHGVVHQMATTLEPKPERADFRFTQFSDCIVISASAETPLGIAYVLASATQLATNLLANQVLIRGGIAVGNLLHTDDALFGPGLLVAYKKDASGAPPRISLDASAVAEIEKHEDRHQLKQYVWRDHHDLTSMLHILRWEASWAPPAMPGIALNDSRATSIAKGIAAQAYSMDSKPQVRAKWLWMERYWNKAVAGTSLPMTTQFIKNADPVD